MQPPMRGRLIHHYRVESLLGEGGMGTVYQATDTHLERPVAMKMLHTHLVNQASFTERFRNEAMILARLNHPNIAVVYNFLQDGSDYFMAMEYVAGDSLETLVRKTGRLSVPVAAEVVRQALEGLAHAHRKGVLHRDIKPANLMLTPEGQVKLMDFGIARVIGNQRMTQANRLVGTLEYMAPELVQGEAPSPSSDIYAIGILLYELLSGKLPFASRTDFALMQAIIREKPIALRKLNGDIPKEIEAIVHKALDKNPAKRFADAKEFQKALQPYYSQLSVLDPAQLTPAAPAADIMNIQPVRQTVLLETKLVSADTQLGPINPMKRWAAENWQTLLAGGLMLLALLFIGLIVFDSSQEKPIKEKAVLIANQKTPKTERIEPTNQEPVLTTTVTEENNTPVSTPQVRELSPAPAVPVVKKSEPVIRQPRTANPNARPYSNPPTIVGKPEPTSTNSPVETPANPVTPATKPEPTPETVTPRSSAHKSIAIRRLRVSLSLVDGLSSDGAQEGQSIRFRVTEPVVSDGEVVIQSGATAYGEISRIKRADGEVFRKKSLLEFRINSVEAVNGKRISLRSATISEEAKGQPVQFRSGQTFEVRTGDDVITF
ncbi:serine/threonine protein kinase [Spirosoma flavus]